MNTAVEKDPRLAMDESVAIPEVTLPCGIVVPPFRVGKYLNTRGEDGKPVSRAYGKPWVSISFFDAVKVCEEAGRPLIRELQRLAIAHDLAGVDANWTGGKVGEGKLRQGLRNMPFSFGAQPGGYVSDDPDQSRLFTLSNGEQLVNWAGNAFSWLVDDVQGDEQGLVARPFAADSPSLTTSPFPSMQRGVGWMPDAGADWSGRALVCGGCWRSGDYAGVFRLDRGDPHYARDLVGFRSTYPL